MRPLGEYWLNGRVGFHGIWIVFKKKQKVKCEEGGRTSVVVADVSERKDDANNREETRREEDRTR